MTEYSKPLLFPPVKLLCKCQILLNLCCLQAHVLFIWLRYPTLSKGKIARNLSLSFSLILWEDSEWVDWRVIVFFLYLLVKLTISALHFIFPYDMSPRRNTLKTWVTPKEEKLVVQSKCHRRDTSADKWPHTFLKHYTWCFLNRTTSILLQKLATAAEIEKRLDVLLSVHAL